MSDESRKNLMIFISALESDPIMGLSDIELCQDRDLAERRIIYEEIIDNLKSRLKE